MDSPETFGPGKLRGLERIATPEGVFAICAMDHRGSLQRMIDPDNPERVTYRAMVEQKLRLCEALAPDSSAVLLDPIYGAPQCLARGALPRGTGLLVSLEATGYEGPSDRRRTSLLEGWSPRKARMLGADAAKLLVYFHPDRAEEASYQLNVIAEAARASAEADIPLLVEAVAYAIGGASKDSAAFAAERPRIVLESARQITALPIDILKAEFPADLRHERDDARMLDLCRQLSEASPVPWVVLSAGVDYEQFRRQVDLACRGGASGFLGGRAIWQEAFDLEPARREAFLKATALERLRELRDIAVRHATPWQRRSRHLYPSLDQVSEGWYRGYGAREGRER